MASSEALEYGQVIVLRNLYGEGSYLDTHGQVRGGYDVCCCPTSNRTRGEQTGHWVVESPRGKEGPVNYGEAVLIKNLYGVQTWLDVFGKQADGVSVCTSTKTKVAASGLAGMHWAFESADGKTGPVACGAETHIRNLSPEQETWLDARGRKHDGLDAYGATSRNRTESRGNKKSGHWTVAVLGGSAPASEPATNAKVNEPTADAKADDQGNQGNQGDHQGAKGSGDDPAVDTPHIRISSYVSEAGDDARSSTTVAIMALADDVAKEDAEQPKAQANDGANADEPADGSGERASTDEPSAENSKSGGRSASNTTASKPAADAKADVPVADAKADELAADAKADELVADAKADEPVVDAKADEAAADAKADEPVAAAKADELAADAKADELVADAKADELVADAKADEAAADAKADEPVVDAKADEAAADVKADEPVVDAKADEAAADAKAEEPAAHATADKAAGDANVDKPAVGTLVSQAGHAKADESAAEASVEAKPDTPTADSIAGAKETEPTTSADGHEPATNTKVGGQAEVTGGKEAAAGSVPFLETAPDGAARKEYDSFESDDEDEGDGKEAAADTPSIRIDSYVSEAGDDAPRNSTAVALMKLAGDIANGALQQASNGTSDGPAGGPGKRANAGKQHAEAEGAIRDTDRNVTDLASAKTDAVAAEASHDDPAVRSAEEDGEAKDLPAEVTYGPQATDAAAEDTANDPPAASDVRGKARVEKNAADYDSFEDLDEDDDSSGADSDVITAIVAQPKPPRQARPASARRQRPPRDETSVAKYMRERPQTASIARPREEPATPPKALTRTRTIALGEDTVYRFKSPQGKEAWNGWARHRKERDIEERREKEAEWQKKCDLVKMYQGRNSPGGGHGRDTAFDTWYRNKRRQQQSERRRKAEKKKQKAKNVMTAGQRQAFEHQAYVEWKRSKAMELRQQKADVFMRVKQLKRNFRRTKKNLQRPFSKGGDICEERAKPRRGPSGDSDVW